MRRNERIAAAFLICALSSLGVLFAQSLGSEKWDFEHYDHVSEAWLDPERPEVARDCQGCHDATEPSSLNADALCSKCHASNSVNESTFRVQTSWSESSLAGLHDATSTFVHGDHVGFSCRECHASSKMRAGGGPFPSGAPIPIRKGYAECSRCHGVDDPDYQDLASLGDDPPREASQILQEHLNGDARMGPEGLGRFRHADHLEDPGLGRSLQELLTQKGDDKTCADCHQVLSAEPKEKPVFYSDDSCGDCHLTDSKAPVRFFEREEPLPSLSAGSFVHADHLKLDFGSDGTKATAEAYDRIKEQGCQACHQFTEQGRGEDFAFHTRAESYEGCIACHDLPQWKTQSHGEWDSCLACHTFTGPKPDLLHDRLRTTAQRRRPEYFEFETQAHPMITGVAAEDLAKDCAKCHRAPVAELPSKLQRKKFNHATHLPPDPGPESCAACHGSRIDATRLSAQIGATFSGQLTDRIDLQGLTYDPAACTQCHQGPPPQPGFTDMQEVTPFEFSHAGHIGKVHPTRGTLGCVSCHSVNPADAGRYFETANCVSCHDHSEFAEVTGGLGGTDATSCAVCHEAEIPERGAQARGERRRITRIEGFQHHPAATSCVKCHLQTGSTLLLPKLGNVQALTTASARFPSEVHRQGWGMTDDKRCMNCHWSVKRVTMPEDPLSRRVRDTLGNALFGFPGGERTQ